MKIKKSILLSIIEECILEESRLIEAIDRQMEEDIIDLWANMLDSLRDPNEQTEISQTVSDIWSALTKVEESMISESPEIWRREIKKSIEQGELSFEQLADGIVTLNNKEAPGTWMRETSGHRDLLAKLGVDLGEEPGEQADVGPTTATPDVSAASSTPDVSAPGGPTIDTKPAGGTSSGIPMPPGMTSRGLKAKDVLSKSLTQREMPNMTTVNQLRQFDKTSGRKFEKALLASQFFGAKVKGASGAKIDDNDYLNITRSLYTALNKLGVTKLSESRLKQAILEETIAVLKEVKKR